MSDLVRERYHPPQTPPPCPERCWEKLDLGWRHVWPHDECCRWDSPTLKWIWCKEKP